MTAKAEKPRGTRGPDHTDDTDHIGDGAGRTWGAVLLRALTVAIAFLFLVAFSAVLARLTLTPSAASQELVTTNLRPGASLRQYAEDYTFLAACKQIGGNLLLGVPFGLLLPVLVPRRLRMLRVIALTVVVMVLVELAQGAVVQGRAFDVDDVILNTAGALIGYLLLGRRIGRAAGSKRRPARDKRPARDERRSARDDDAPRTSSSDV